MTFLCVGSKDYNTNSLHSSAIRWLLVFRLGMNAKRLELVILLAEGVSASLWSLSPLGTGWEGLDYGCWCNVGANYDFSGYKM